MAVVVEYDLAWTAQFEAERLRIDNALGATLTGAVEHIGSTSIPGMPAKPILDMMAPVQHLAAARAAVADLAPLGYAERAHRADAVRFVKPDTDDVASVTHHLHLTERSSELWRERLLFRDAVRADPELLAEYAALKRLLLERSGGAAYRAEDKRDFVRRVLAAAGHGLRDGLHADGRP